MSTAKYSAIYKAVGNRIAEARRGTARRLTQQQLADRTQGELSRSALANIERGRQRVALHHLYLIARSLEVEPVKFLPSVRDVFEIEDDHLQRELAVDPKLAPWLSRVIRKPVRKE